MRKLILIAVFYFLAQHLCSQVNPGKEYRLSVVLHNAPFHSLAIRDYRDLHSVIIKGKKVGEFKWEFKIPYAIVADSEFMQLIIPEKDTVANAYRQVRFTRSFGNKKTLNAHIGIQDETNYIEADYKESEVFENENVAYISGIPDSVIPGTLICDDFELSVKNDNSDIMIRSLDAYYAWFESGNNNLSYKENLQKYISLAKKFPDSRYLITSLSSNLLKFETRSDVEKVYGSLSGKFKNSKWAKRIERYLSADFKNIQFVNMDSKNTEPLVMDSSKHNLFIFSASGCGPCIQEMPLLKELHQQLKGRINFTTISMDNETKVKVFRELLRKNDIQWRTLYAFKDLEGVTDLYAVRMIPLTILVYPDGRMERMDIREEANQRKLLSLTL